VNRAQTAGEHAEQLIQRFDHSFWVCFRPCFCEASSSYLVSLLALSLSAVEAMRNHHRSQRFELNPTRKRTTRHLPTTPHLKAPRRPHTRCRLKMTPCPTRPLKFANALKWALWRRCFSARTDLVTSLFLVSLATDLVLAVLFYVIMILYLYGDLAVCLSLYGVRSYE